MATTTPTDKNATLEQYRQRARDRLHDATHLGTDETGAVHFWSIYHQTILVFDNGSSHEITTPSKTPDDTRIETPLDWANYIERHHGWVSLKVSSGIVEDLVAGRD